MREIEIHDYARQLLEARGAQAIAEAAQNAIDLEVKGEVELARTWRHIEDAAGSRCIRRTRGQSASSFVRRTPRAIPIWPSPRC